MNNTLFYAKIRKTGDLDYLPPMLKTDVALHCMALANRMHKRILYKTRGWRFIFTRCYMKQWNKYSAMYKFYDGYVHDELNKYIDIVEKYSKFP